MKLKTILPVLALGALLACQKPTDLITPDNPTSIDSLGTPTEVGKLTSVPTTKTIGPAGGTITTPDGKITLDFPAGAVRQETTITVQTGENEAPNGVGAGINISPADLTFEQPVTMTYTFQGQELSGTSVDAMGVAYQDGRKAWQLTGLATADKAKKTVKTRLNKGAWWSLITQYKLSPEQTTINVNEPLELILTRVGGDDLTFSKGDKLSALTLQDARKDVSRLFINGVDWTAIPPKDQHFGTISQNKQTGQILFTAPGQKPDPNPVMVSLELKNSASNAVLLLVSAITIAKGDYLTINGHSFDNGLSALGVAANGQVIISASGNNGGGKDGVFYVTLDNMSVGAHSFSADYKHGTTIQAMDQSGIGDYIEGTSYYDKCSEALTEAGTVDVLSAERVNGSVKLVLKVSGSVVTVHEGGPTDGGCVVTKHKTMPVQAGLTVFVKQ